MDDGGSGALYQAVLKAYFRQVGFAELGFETREMPRSRLRTVKKC